MKVGACRFKVCGIGIYYVAMGVCSMYGCSERVPPDSFGDVVSDTNKKPSQDAILLHEPEVKALEQSPVKPKVSPAEGHPEALKRIDELLQEAANGNFTSLMTLGLADANKKYIISGLYEREIALLSHDDSHKRFHVHVMAKLGDADARIEVVKMLNSKVYISEESALQALV